MAGLARTCVLTLASVGAFLLACGHLPFDEVPGDDAGSGTGPLDGGPDVNNGGNDSGADADPLDASRDAGCSGPTCPGTFVSQTVGKDTNPGTAAAPVQTIKKGIEIASTLGGKQSVYVAAGHYPEKVTLVENVDLLGGYDCSATSCTWARNSTQNDTAINNQDYEGVVAPKTVTRKTVFDGFRVVGKPGGPTLFPGSAGISILGGSPTIANCRIIGGDVNAGPVKRSVGVAILAPTLDPGPLLDRNAISGGASVDESFGVTFDSKAGSPNLLTVGIVTNNDIRGGTAPFTSGMFATSSSNGAVIKNNEISGGNSSSLGGPTTSSWGITISSAGTIERNRINTSATAGAMAACTQNVNGNFCGGVQSLGSRATIINNVIAGVKGVKTCAVLLTNNEGAPAGLAVTVNSNTLDGAGGAADGSISTAIALRIEIGSSTTIGKVRNNILLGGTNKNRYGVYEEKTPGKTAHLAALDNNNFFNPPPARTDFAYRSFDGTTELDLTFAELSQVQGVVPSGNKSVDCGLNATYHIAANSECVDKGSTTEAPPQDFEGDPRPKGGGYDIGADEVK